MKYPYKPSKSNIIFAVIFLIIIAFLNFRIYGFESFTLGMIVGTLVISLIISTLFAIIVWFIKGRKYKAGSLTFNLVLGLILLGSFSEFGNIIKDRNEPIDEINTAVKEYKNSARENQYGTNENVDKFTSIFQESLDKLIKTSVGDEQQMYVIVKKYHQKMDSINTTWNLAHEKFMDPRVLDFKSLQDEKNYDFQLNAINEYVEKSKMYQDFFKNRLNYLFKRIDALNSSNKVIAGFKQSFEKKDSIQQPVFQEYLNAHVSYGKNFKDLIKLLEENDGKWKMIDEEIIFENSNNQDQYNQILNEAIENEERINLYSDKVLEVM